MKKPKLIEGLSDSKNDEILTGVRMILGLSSETTSEEMLEHPGFKEAVRFIIMNIQLYEPPSKEEFRLSLERVFKEDAQREPISREEIDARLSDCGKIIDEFRERLGADTIEDISKKIRERYLSAYGIRKEK